MWETEIVAIEEGLGIVLPDELLKRLNILSDTTLYLTEHEGYLKIAVANNLPE